MQDNYYLVLYIEGKKFKARRGFIGYDLHISHILRAQNLQKKKRKKLI